MTPVVHNRELDQFFTNREVAKLCFDTLEQVVGPLNSYLEPSAGDGALMEQIPEGRNVLAFDLDPKREGITQADFFTVNAVADATFMNPPFGRRSSLAIEFFNRASSMTPIVAQIVPVQFRKWGVQRKLNPGFKLIHDELLRPDAFVFNGKPYTVRCCFQIWVQEDLLPEKADLRLQSAPEISHPDFKMWQYNNTKEALKVFEEDFDFAVPRQGWQDYSRREEDPDACEKSKQWILFKAKNKRVLNRLNKIDFDSLSKKNTSTPGFGKADVVAHYKGL